MKEIRTRFAPSPTGFLHIGGLRTALYSYAFAKSQGGKFILRIEDTDIKRYIEGAKEKICEILKIFGLNWDEGPEVGGPYAPYIQSERVKVGIYKKYAEILLNSGRAYYCFCSFPPEEILKSKDKRREIKLRDDCRNLSPKEIRRLLERGEKPAIRLRLPEGEKVSYFDFVLKKEIYWKTDFVDEVVLLKSDGFPTYHLAVVVDDAEMKISHILRGHDWLPSTPIHLLLFKYLNFPVPQIGHLTDILDPSGGKLSKRKGTVACEDFLSQGYLPEAILNFVMLLGWAPKDNREIFSLSDFVANFQKGNLQVSNPVFNQKKLDWFNGFYIRNKKDDCLLQLIKPFAPRNASPRLINQTIPLIKERIKKLSDYSSLAGFFFKEPKIDKKLFTKGAKEQLLLALEVLEKNKNWDKKNLEKELQKLVKEKSWQVGDFFMNFRIAIAGSKITPPITDSIEILGKDKTLKRLKVAVALL